MQVYYRRTSEYFPALSFYKSAKKWCKEAQLVNNKIEVGEPGRLCLIYAAFTLESFISEELWNRLPEPEYNRLFNNRVRFSIRHKWTQGCDFLSTPENSSQEGLSIISNECSDKGGYGLLVRSRNKLIHPKYHKEVFENDKHEILDRSLNTLITDLKDAHNFPQYIDSFPDIIISADAALWYHNIVQNMIRSFYLSINEPLQESWVQEFESDVLS